MAIPAKTVLIGKTAVALATGTTTITGLSDGQIGIFNPTGTIQTTGSQDIILASGAASGRNPRLTKIIRKGTTTAIYKRVYANPANQVWNIGYVGSGAATNNFVLPTASYNPAYGLKVQNMSTIYPPFPTVYAQYTHKYGATNQNPLYVADQLALDLNNQLLVNSTTASGGQYAYVDVLTNLTLATAPFTAGGTATVAYTNGSPTVVFTDSGTSTSFAAGLAAGCWIRIGSSATTDPVYQISSVVNTSATVTTVTLTRPFVGTSVTAGALTTIKVGASASILPASDTLVGFRVTVAGNLFTSNNWAETKPNTMVNVVCTDNLASTVRSIGTSYLDGVGTVAQISKMERESMGYIGAENRTQLPYANDEYATAYAAAAALTSPPTAGYTVYTILVNETFSGHSAQGLQKNEPYHVELCVNSGDSSLISSLDTQLAAVLNATVTTL